MTNEMNKNLKEKKHLRLKRIKMSSLKRVHGVFTVNWKDTATIAIKMAAQRRFISMGYAGTRVFLN